MVFNLAEAYSDMRVEVPCGKCIGCRLEKSRQWAVRCVHEASLHKQNCFITLTFNDENLPANMSLEVEIFQKFMKRLRKKYGEGIRFFHCGEYGSKFGRPHYHAAIFGFDFEDKTIYKTVNGGHILYRSKSLEALWPYGYSTIGALTFESAAYVARYVVKKITGKDSAEHYEYVDQSTGEVFDRKPEYCTMSRRPGLAAGWFAQYHSDVYPNDSIVLRGKQMMPPRYYDKLFECQDPINFHKTKIRRAEKAKTNPDAGNYQRLDVQDQCLQLKNKTLIRKLEQEL